MASTHEQTIEIRDLSTKLVTFYPQKAEIVREIPNVKLKPGFNEITITGVTPIADESSIKVEAHGTTTITDMVIELVKNPDHFGDVYGSDSEDDEEESDEDSLKPTDEIKALHAGLVQLTTKQAAYEETIKSSQLSLVIIEKLLEKLEVKQPEEVRAAMVIYQEQRARFYHDLAKAKAEKIKVDEEKAEVDDKKARLELKHSRQHAKTLAKKSKAKAKKQREKTRQQTEKNRVSKERAKFWPKKIYTIKVTIESNVMTPGTSRRGSFESLATANTVMADDSKAEPTSTSLLLTYIVKGASWTPKYDLNLSTITSTGSMNYRAEIENTTSETWKDAKIVLSTSRATFSGVSEPIPVIKPWLLQLQKSSAAYQELQPSLSTQEKDSAAARRTTGATKATDAINREAWFGVDVPKEGAALEDYSLQLMLLEQQNKKRLQMARQEQDPAQLPTYTGMPQQAPTTDLAFGEMVDSSSRLALPAPLMATPLGPPGSSRPAAAAFGGGSMAYSQTMPISRSKKSKSVIAGSSERRKKESLTDEEEEDEEEQAGDDGDSDDGPGWEESGLTTNLELRGIRSIEPSSNKRRFKIATVRLNQLTLTHIVVPKLKPEAFLRARIVNTSPTALLKGSAGLTLDGTFLGHTTIPRCSAGENFPLPLGIDPAIAVAYPTPITRKNVGGGVFNKENSTTFTRSVVLTNTRTSGAAVSVTVKDQVPVSEDERLKIDIASPRGLSDEGDRVKTGVEYLSANTAKIGADKKKSDNTPWGQAIAKMCKLGLIEWTVTLNPGKAVRLTMEYTVRFPGSDRVTEAFRPGGFENEELGKE